MKDPRIDGLARVIVNYSLELGEGQSFFISSGVAAEPLVQALYEEALRAGANPVLDLSLEGTQSAFYELAGDAQILVALGPSCSSGARVGAPILWNAGIAAIGIGASAISRSGDSSGSSLASCGWVPTVHQMSGCWATWRTFS